MGAVYELIYLSISPASNKFSVSSFTNLWCFRGKGYGLLSTGVKLWSVSIVMSSKCVSLMSVPCLLIMSAYFCCDVSNFCLSLTIFQHVLSLILALGKNYDGT